METEQWYVVKLVEVQCQIVTVQELETLQTNATPIEEQWGPFDSKGEAIARRVGLIRAGKCQPA